MNNTNSTEFLRPLLSVRGVSKYYGAFVGCEQIDFDLWPGEVLGVVGESGSGKSTLLNCLSARLPADDGRVVYDNGMDDPVDMFTATEYYRRRLLRTEWGMVCQTPADGLRMAVSAGGNIGERLMGVGNRHYGNIRESALHWLEEVEIDARFMDRSPRTFSGGMQQRLQIARSLAVNPRLMFMDEPTGGLDVSVQARLLDLLRKLVSRHALSVILVTHDLAVARLLAHRLIVMRRGRIVETGLTDRVLDDPQHPYTQLLVSSILEV